MWVVGGVDTGNNRRNVSRVWLLHRTPMFYFRHRKIRRDHHSINVKHHLLSRQVRMLQQAIFRFLETEMGNSARSCRA